MPIKCEKWKEKQTKCSNKCGETSVFHLATTNRNAQSLRVNIPDSNFSARYWEIENSRWRPMCNWNNKKKAKLFIAFEESLWATAIAFFFWNGVSFVRCAFIINQTAINNESAFEVALKYEHWSIYWIEKENVLIWWKYLEHEFIGVYGSVLELHMFLCFGERTVHSNMLRIFNSVFFSSCLLFLFVLAVFVFRFIMQSRKTSSWFRSLPITLQIETRSLSISTDWNLKPRWINWINYKQN